MPTFIPPTDDFVHYGDYTQGGLQLRLWRFYKPEPRGRNVYLLTNGTYTEVDQRDTGQVVKVYLGGHVIDITDAEAASLTAAGYGAYIS
jgi:hypothetical protein